MSIGRRGSLFVLSSLGLLVAYGCGGGKGGSDFVPPNTLDNAEVEAGTDPNTFGSSSGGSSSGGEAGASKPTCGNSVKDTGETCDDGNATGGDGCSATCQIEKGYACPTLGAACIAAACGDGIVAGDEDCDDGNHTAGDGCSAVCTFEPGYECVVPGKPCTKTVCGDGKKEGTEQCDDGNLRPYDGCSATCTIEPKCAGGACTAVCGDGVVFPGEACDDGNLRDGDGCSSTCTLEKGFTCTITTSGIPSAIDLPVIYRDFTPDTNPDFEKFLGSGASTGLVQSTLDPAGFPAFKSTTSDAGNQMLTSAASFAAWWIENPLVEKTIFDQTLHLPLQSDGVSYQYASTSFFNIDGLGWGNYSTSGHNFHFTTEVRYYFTFKGTGTETFNFVGDDDVWVFVNGKLAVDLGGTHQATAGGVTLDTATATSLGLTKGGLYEIDLFQAERHTTQSNYTLTVGGFETASTSCAPICGDGIKTKYEACDDGKAGNTGGYGKCTSTCTLGPRCGDGVTQTADGETCDDGNLINGDGCSSTCKVEGTITK